MNVQCALAIHINLLRFDSWLLRNNPTRKRKWFTTQSLAGPETLNARDLYKFGNDWIVLFSLLKMPIEMWL